MNTVIYARFSSELQNPRSIEDQIAICRERCQREGWSIVGIHVDYAISGAAGLNQEQRPGIAALLAQVASGGVEQVLTEATDRIARHEGDSYALRERLIFAGVRLFTLSDGEVTPFIGAIKGAMDAEFRRTLRAKIKRGQRGTVSDGRSPAGLAYGYRLANRIDENGRAIRGLREIEPDQAVIVVRIFIEYAAGISPVKIAERLNADGVPGPRDGRWRATTIRPDKARGNGILKNELYVGRLVHNRTRKVTDPTTRRTLIRVNEEKERIVQQVPQLRIVDQCLWDRVQRGLAQRETSRPNHARRPKHVFSGLGVCGICNGPWTIKTATYWGCATRREGSGCSNNRTISTESYERRVLSGLKERMLDPELVSIFIQEYHAERGRRALVMQRNSAGLQRKVVDATSRIERLVGAIASGASDFSEIRGALEKARTDRAAAIAALADADALPVLALHPTIAADYRRQVDGLQEALARPEASIEAIPAIRALIDRIVMNPKSDGRGVSIEVFGRLAGIIALATGEEPPETLTAKVERVKGIEPSS